jgi:hypothetical protein
MISYNKNHLFLKIALGVAVLAIITLTVLLFQQYQHIERLGYVSVHRQSLLRSLHGSGPLTAADASSTAAWMTFGYINRAFVLPSSYLETNLNIIDTRYPRMTIIEYGNDAGISQAAALSRVQNAISTYFPANQ